MIFGEFNQQIDEKGRTRIPPRIKPFLSSDVTITKGTNGCLFLFQADAQYYNLSKKLLEVPMSDLMAQRSVRAFFSSGSILEEDNQGRFLLPKNLREYAGIKKDVVYIGVGNRAELWARENYEAYMGGETPKGSFDFDKLFAELQKYGV